MTSSSRTTLVGVIGALVLCASLGSLWALSVPLFAPADESAHADYGLQVADGRIPTMGARIEPELGALGQRPIVQYVANHPPLYYAISGPIERLGVDTGHPRAALLGVRLLGVGLAMACVVGVAALASIICRNGRGGVRTQVVVTAAALTASVPSFVVASASIQNDGVTILLSILTLVLIAIAVRRGVGLQVTSALAVVSALGMLSRLSYLPFVLTAAGALLLLACFPGLRARVPTGRSVTKGLVAAAAVLAVTCLGAGWFYLRNLRLYGDLTASSVAYRLVEGRDWATGSENGFLAYALRPASWWIQIRQLTGVPSADLESGSAIHTVLAVALVAIVIGGLALTIRARRRLLDYEGRWILAGLGVVALGAYAELVHHVVHGGAENNRYLLGALAFGTIGTAVVLVAFRRLQPLACFTLVAIGGFGCVAYTTAIARRTAPDASWLGALQIGAEQNQVPLANLTPAALVVAAAVGLVLVVGSLMAGQRDQAHDTGDRRQHDGEPGRQRDGERGPSPQPVEAGPERQR